MRMNNPTIAIIAQQQRSPDVFEAWLKETLRLFRVWRIDEFEKNTPPLPPPSLLLSEAGKRIALGDGSGYVVHVLVLRSELSHELPVQ